MLRNLHLQLGPLTVDGTFLLGSLSAVVALVIALYLLRSGHRLAALTRIALALVLAGAAGNMIDRFRLHYVVDFIHFHVRGFDFAVFNVADASIVVGAGLLLLASVLSSGAREATTSRRRAPSHPRTDRSIAAVTDFPDVPPLRPERREEAEGGSRGEAVRGGEAARPGDAG